jgi:N-acetylglutamate synthase
MPADIQTAHCEEIRRIEELSYNAWPSQKAVYLDGWLLRFAEGYTRRANSVNPLYGHAEDVEAQIARCEEVYTREGLPVVFKMTAAVQPADLDTRLEARGYRSEGRTQVMSCALRRSDIAMPNLTLRERYSEEWLDAFLSISGTRPDRRALLDQLLRAIVPQACYGAVYEDERIVSVGLAVIERGYVGLFDVATDPTHRRQGHAARLCTALMEWGRSHEAHTAYLQVFEENTDARRLYEKLGYTSLYPYWYRVRP